MAELAQAEGRTLEHPGSASAEPLRACLAWLGAPPGDRPVTALLRRVGRLPGGLAAMSGLARLFWLAAVMLLEKSRAAGTLPVPGARRPPFFLLALASAVLDPLHWGAWLVLSHFVATVEQLGRIVAQLRAAVVHIRGSPLFGLEHAVALSLMGRLFEAHTLTTVLRTEPASALRVLLTGRGTGQDTGGGCDRCMPAPAGQAACICLGPVFLLAAGHGGVAAVLLARAHALQGDLAGARALLAPVARASFHHYGAELSGLLFRLLPLDDHLPEGGGCTGGGALAPGDPEAELTRLLVCLPAREALGLLAEVALAEDPAGVRPGSLVVQADHAMALFLTGWESVHLRRATGLLERAVCGLPAGVGLASDHAGGPDDAWASLAGAYALAEAPALAAEAFLWPLAGRSDGWAGGQRAALGLSQVYHRMGKSSLAGLWAWRACAESPADPRSWALLRDSLSEQGQSCLDRLLPEVQNMAPTSMDDLLAHFD
ncbi:hypothetical protein, variant [Fonticula alba]|nr:hypothetical protein, variant [Fonticula alba]KCV71630.1 hypothetical protein, variant [Fonticula alba]|eukprot:XP_009493207.1 hypothetical protein, variant [Fonticula alba]